MLWVLGDMFWHVIGSRRHVTTCYGFSETCYDMLWVLGDMLWDLGDMLWHVTGSRRHVMGSRRHVMTCYWFPETCYDMLWVLGDMLLGLGTLMQFLGLLDGLQQISHASLINFPQGLFNCTTILSVENEIFSFTFYNILFGIPHNLMDVY